MHSFGFGQLSDQLEILYCTEFNSLPPNKTCSSWKIWPTHNELCTTFWPLWNTPHA